MLLSEVIFPDSLFLWSHFQTEAKDTLSLPEGLWVSVPPCSSDPRLYGNLPLFNSFQTAWLLWLPQDLNSPQSWSTDRSMLDIPTSTVMMGEVSESLLREWCSPDIERERESKKTRCLKWYLLWPIHPGMNENTVNTLVTKHLRSILVWMKTV